MSAVDQLFTHLRRQQQKALMPFITAGDPDLAFTAEVLRALHARGCHLAEVGFPYSDPIADGPVIQASYTRALANGLRTSAIMETLQGLRPEVTMPMVAMVSYAIIYRLGAEAFLDRAQAAGLAGAIVPDLLVEESQALAELCRARDFSLIQLVTPTTSRERALRIAEQTTGFIYYVSVTGITGERTQLPPELRDNVGWLREQTDLPLCIGFGISQPEHVRLLAPVADGLIVGSAIVRRMAAAAQDRAAALADVGQFVEQLLAALPPAQV